MGEGDTLCNFDWPIMALHTELSDIHLACWGGTYSTHGVLTYIDTLPNSVILSRCAEPQPCGPQMRSPQ